MAGNQTGLYIDSVSGIVSDAISLFSNPTDVTERNTLPENETWYWMSAWIKVPDVICVYVDIRNSTGMSAVLQTRSTAAIYELFVNTAVRIFHEFDAEYIDIKWDGVFALFSKWRHFRALAAAVTFKTFCDKEFVKRSKKKYKDLDIGVHLWMDQKTVIVKQIWLKDHPARDRRKNEVWAGKPINMAAKLASRSWDSGLLISERFYQNIKSEAIAIKSCWCHDWNPSSEKTELWEEVDLSSETVFDFNKAWRLKTHWCNIHWKEYCEKMLSL